MESLMDATRKDQIRTENQNQNTETVPNTKPYYENPDLLDCFQNFPFA